MLIEQIVELEMRGLEPPNCTCTSRTSNFYAKQESLEENLRVDYYLLLKYCTR